MHSLKNQLGIVFISVIVILAGHCSSLGNRASFQEPCGNGTRCDSRASLVCLDGTCQCIKPDEMKFSDEEGKCLVLSGERCSYNVEPSSSSFMNSTSISGPEIRYSETLPCVENAVCKSDGFCSCKPNYFENTKGFCNLKRRHGDSCSNDKECMSEQYLICRDNSNLTLTCACNSTESIPIYGATGTKCVGLAGSRCNPKDSHCHENATCGPDLVCQCKTPDYYKNWEGLCIPKKTHGEICAEDRECHEGQQLRCLKGQCDCGMDGTAFDYAKRRCARKAGTDCSEDEQCVSNSRCTSDYYAEGRGRMKCCCREGYGYKQSPEGLCLGDHGMSCQRSSECNHKLDCIQSKCSCPFPDYQWWDDRNKVCKSELGGPCHEKRENGKNLTFACKNGNAVCKNVLESGLHECTCKDGFIRGIKPEEYCYQHSCSFYPTCFVAHGHSCAGDDAGNCDPVAGLQCRNEKCSCPEFKIYDSELEKCLGLVGAKCKVGEKKGRECVDRAYCKSRRFVSVMPNVADGTCACEHGFIPTANRFCVEGTFNVLAIPMGPIN